MADTGTFPARSGRELKCVCIVCRKEMRNYLADGIQPSDGLAFSTSGHYGSTVFDPVHGACLVACICDACVTKAAQDGIVFHSEMTQIAKFECTPWDGKNPHDGYTVIESIEDTP